MGKEKVLDREGVQCVVWAVGDWKPSTRKGKKSGGDNLHVVMKIVKGNLKSKYGKDVNYISLNLDTADPQAVLAWENDIVEGNVIDMSAMFYFTKWIVDRYAPHSIVKRSK